MPRSYDNRRRARAAEGTAERIIDATEALLSTLALADLSLKAIADASGVTVQTVLRHMGSREGCLDALRQRVAARIDGQRQQSEAGDVAGALAGLLAHYEAEGRLILRLLEQEAADPFARQAAAEGRAYHRAWVERCFGPCLPKGDHRLVVDCVVAATDLSVWRLLRLDLGRSQADTGAVMRRLLLATLEHG